MVITLPRLIRQKDAPSYLGMDRKIFNKTVRPKLPPIRIGVQGIAYDRFDLDAWVEDNKKADWHPENLGESSWDVKSYRASTKGAAYGSSIKRSSDADFVKALEQATSKKHRAT